MHRKPRLIILIVLGFTALVGVGLFIVGTMMPATSNQSAYDAAIDDYYSSLDTGSESFDSRASSDKYYAIQDKYSSGASITQDRGVALVTLALTLAILLLIVNRRGSVVTPNKPLLFALANGSLILTVIVAIVRIYIDQVRGAYPPAADSIAIPIFGLIVVYCLLVVPMNGVLVGLSFIYKQAVLSKKFITDRATDRHFIRRILLTTIALLFGAITVISMAYGAYDQVVFGVLFGGFSFLLFYGMLYRRAYALRR